MVDLTGFEPVTYPLWAECSTAELKVRISSEGRIRTDVFGLWDQAGTISSLPRDIAVYEGFDPSTSAWQADMIATSLIDQ